MARLKPGVTTEQAQADVSVIAARIRDKDKRDRTFTIGVVPLLEQVVGNVRRAVLVLLGSVALVLLIACANVANLLLTRASGRQKEVAIRTALGAGWQRLVRQLLTESLLLGLMGGVAGLLIARLSLLCRPRGQSRQHPAARRHRARRRCAGVHLRGVDPDRHPLRAGAGDPRSARRSQHRAQGRRQKRAGGRRVRLVAAPAAQPARGLGARALADAADRRGTARSQLRASAERLPGIQSRERDLDAARPDRHGSVEPGRRARVLPPGWRPPRQGPGDHGARRRHGAAVHVVGWLGEHQRRRLDAAARTGAAGRPARRDARLLPDDGDSADQGAVLQRLRRSAQRAASRHHRREVRAAFLARRESDRQACLERSRNDR